MTEPVTVFDTARRPELFQSGEFRLHSGATSSFKIDCDALTDNDLATLAVLVAARFRYSSVFGIPSGGTRFAEACRRYVVPDSSLPRLLVDDVYTTGGSVRYHRQHDDLIVVIFAREVVPIGVDAIFGMWVDA